jgi:hypothetical protein
MDVVLRRHGCLSLLEQFASILRSPNADVQQLYTLVWYILELPSSAVNISVFLRSK